MEIKECSKIGEDLNLRVIERHDEELGRTPPVVAFQCCLRDAKASKYFRFPGSSAGKKSARSVGDLGLVPGLGRPPEKGNGYPLQYFGLENSMYYILHGVAKESDMTECLLLH